MMQLLIQSNGKIRCLYSETIDLGSLGQLTIARGSYVEPDPQGKWFVDLAPVNGPRLGPFPCRSQALEAEQAWLEANWLRECSFCYPRVLSISNPIEKNITMKILFINNDGGGFADHIELEDGTTVTELFAEKVPKGRPQDYLIRVNRQPAAAEQALHDGDRVSFTPVKIEGAL